jgi:hypothetical protein
MTGPRTQQEYGWRSLGGCSVNAWMTSRLQCRGRRDHDLREPHRDRRLASGLYRALGRVRGRGPQPCRTRRGDDRPSGTRSTVSMWTLAPRTGRPHPRSPKLHVGTANPVRFTLSEDSSRGIGRGLRDHDIACVCVMRAISRSEAHRSWTSGTPVSECTVHRTTKPRLRAGLWAKSWSVGPRPKVSGRCPPPSPRLPRPCARRTPPAPRPSRVPGRRSGRASGPAPWRRRRTPRA